MNQIHFTIVIPTKNRLDTLRHTLKTCLDQDYENFSVIIANNNCTDGATEYISSLNDPRITEIISNVDLSMTDNWSQVMPQAISHHGYVTFLGDDDGLLPNCLDLASKLIKKFDAKVLTWRKGEYAWPEIIVDRYKNYFSISTDLSIEVHRSSEYLEKSHNFSIGYDEGPGLYSSFVNVDILKGLSGPEIQWFAAASPDVYSCYAIASSVPEYLRCNFGLSLNGASKHSNGISSLHSPESDALKLFKEVSNLHPSLTYAPSVAIAAADGLLVARERFPKNFVGYDFSWKGLIERMLFDIQNAPTLVHYELLVAGLQKIINYSNETMPDLPDFVGKVEPEKLRDLRAIDQNSNRITCTLDPDLVSNVYDAGLFANSLFPLSEIEIEKISFIKIIKDDQKVTNSESQNKIEILPPVYKPNVLKKTYRFFVNPVKKYRHWLRNSKKIENWFSKESEISRWLKNEGLINQMIQSDEVLRRKEEVLRSEFVEFERLSENLKWRKLDVDWDDRYLCLDDKTKDTGFDRHYVYHPAWAARVLAKVAPRKHTDFSSTLNFCSLISAFIPVDFYDYRPAPLHLSNLNSLEADLLHLPFETNSLESVSCMHVLEHVGLGRYGDPLDPDGDIKAIRELCRVLAPGGTLLIAVPVGKPRVQFNAHRVYDHRDFVSYFRDLELVEFALVPDGDAPNGLIYQAPEHLVGSQQYGCGCYWFQKKVQK